MTKLKKRSLPVFYLAIAPVLVVMVVVLAWPSGKSHMRTDTDKFPLGLLLHAHRGKVTVVGADYRAKRMGVQKGDVLTHLDDTKVRNVTDFVAALRAKKLGDPIRLTVSRQKLALTFNHRLRKPVSELPEGFAEAAQKEWAIARTEAGKGDGPQAGSDVYYADDDSQLRVIESMPSVDEVDGSNTQYTSTQSDDSDVDSNDIGDIAADDRSESTGRTGLKYDLQIDSDQGDDQLFDEFQGGKQSDLRFVDPDDEDSGSILSQQLESLRSPGNPDSLVTDEDDELTTKSLFDSLREAADGDGEAVMPSDLEDLANPEVDGLDDELIPDEDLNAPSDESMDDLLQGAEDLLGDEVGDEMDLDVAEPDVADEGDLLDDSDEGLLEGGDAQELPSLDDVPSVDLPEPPGTDLRGGFDRRSDTERSRTPRDRDADTRGDLESIPAPPGPSNPSVRPIPQSGVDGQMLMTPADGSASCNCGGQVHVLPTHQMIDLPTCTNCGIWPAKKSPPALLGGWLKSLHRRIKHSTHVVKPCATCWGGMTGPYGLLGPQHWWSPSDQFLNPLY